MMSSTNGMGPMPDDDTIPIQISDTVSRGTVKPTYPVSSVPDTPRGRWRCHRQRVRLPRQAGAGAQRQTRLRRHHDGPGVVRRRLSDVLAADDGNAMTVAPIHEMDAGLRRLTEDTYRARGGKGQALPGVGAVSGRGRVDLRFAVDNQGELYILTKSDGMIRKVVGARTTTAPAPTANVSAPRASQDVGNQPAATIRNPVAPRPESIAAGKRAYDVNCAACHGNVAQGAVKAGIAISIIEEQKGRQPPDLTDDQWDHGSTDGDIFVAIKRGLPPTMMAGFDGRIPDDEIWSIINYIRSLALQK